MCTFRNLFINCTIDTLVGQDPIVFMGKIQRWAFCPMPLDVLTLMLCATRNTKNTSEFDSKSNFLMIVLSSHCLWDKGRFAPRKKASCPGYGTRRPIKWKRKKNSRVISAVNCIVLWFYCHFIIEWYGEHIYEEKCYIRGGIKKFVH